MTRRILLIGTGAVAVAGVVAATLLLTLFGTSERRWRLVDLGTKLINPIEINDRGQVVGEDYTEHGYLWENGKLVEFGAHTIPAAINDRGVVVGSTSVKGHDHAFVWHDGKMLDLGTAGGESSSATAVNDLGQVVGQFEVGRRGHGFLWQRGRMIDLGTLGGDTQPSAINDRGQIVGSSETGSRAERCFLWEHGTMTDLGTIRGHPYCWPTITNRGQIAGGTDDALGSVTSAFLWQNGSMVDLGRLGHGPARSAHISESGSIVINSPSAARLLRGDQATNLGSLGADLTWATRTRSVAINAHDLVIGTSFRVPGASLPFVWERGKMTALPSLGSAGFTWPTAINDRDEIVGTSYSKTGPHGVLWTRRPRS